MPRILVGDFGEGHVEGSGQIGTGTIEVSPITIFFDYSIRHRNLLVVGSTFDGADCRYKKRSCSLDKSGYVLFGNGYSFHGIQGNITIHNNRRNIRKSQ